MLLFVASCKEVLYSPANIGIKNRNMGVLLRNLAELRSGDRRAACPQVVCVGGGIGAAPGSGAVPWLSPESVQRMRSHGMAIATACTYEAIPPGVVMLYSSSFLTLSTAQCEVICKATA